MFSPSSGGDFAEMELFKAWWCLSFAGNSVLNLLGGWNRFYPRKSERHPRQDSQFRPWLGREGLNGSGGRSDEQPQVKQVVGGRNVFHDTGSLERASSPLTSSKDLVKLSLSMTRSWTEIVRARRNLGEERRGL